MREKQEADVVGCLTARLLCVVCCSSPTSMA